MNNKYIQGWWVGQNNQTGRDPEPPSVRQQSSDCGRALRGAEERPAAEECVENLSNRRPR